MITKDINNTDDKEIMYVALIHHNYFQIDPNYKVILNGLKQQYPWLSFLLKAIMTQNT
jgi:hypothetical protein